VTDYSVVTPEARWLRRTFGGSRPLLRVNQAKELRAVRDVLEMKCT